MRYLIATAALLLAACGGPEVAPTAGLGAPYSQPAPMPAGPEAAPVSLQTAPDSPEEAREIARAWLQAKFPGRDVELGEPGPAEGAAGSIYIEVPATVAGSPLLSGAVTLRRVNDVPGSTAEQRRWHVESDTLK